LSNTLKTAKGLLVAPGASESGAFCRKGASLTVSIEEDVVALSPFRKMGLVVRLVSVASKVIEVPAGPEMLAWVSVICMESA